MTGKPLREYGPLQLCQALGIQEWQRERALALNLIGPRNARGKWPAAVVDDAVARRDDIIAQAGRYPDVGAWRAAEILNERLGADVDASAIAELGRTGHLPIVDDYKGHDLYCGRALETFTDRDALATAAVNGEMVTTHEAVNRLRIRRTDFDHLVRLGWIRHHGHARGQWASWIALFRNGDLLDLLANPEVDFEAARAVRRGHRSAFASLPAKPRSAAPETNAT